MTRGDLIAEDAQAWQGPLLALVLGDIDQRPRAVGLGLGRAEHLLVGLELELKGAVAVGQGLVLGLGCAKLLLGGLILLLERVDQLLQLHAADLRLQLLRQLRADLLLANQVHDDGQHEVDQVDGALHDVLLGLRQALGRVPASTLQEEVVDTAVQLAVQLAEVLAAVALGDAVLLALVVWVGRGGAALALASAELLQGRLAVDVLRGNQGHDLVLGEIHGPFGRGGLLSRESLLPGTFGRVGRRGWSSDMFVAGPWRLELRKGVVGARGAGNERLLGMERVEWAARQRLHAWQRRQAAVFAHVGPRQTGGSRFQRAVYHQHEANGTSIHCALTEASSVAGHQSWKPSLHTSW